MNLHVAALMSEACRQILCEPNKVLSTRSEQRFGRHGSLSVDMAKGAYFDHEQGQGGGIIDFLRNVGGLSQDEARAWMRDRGDLPQVSITTAKPPVDRTDKIGRACRIFEKARPAVGTIVERYLTGRGLHLPSDCPLRFDQAVWHPLEKIEAPAMIAPIVGIHGNDFLGVHLTFLSITGKAKARFNNPKIIRGTKRGGCVKLTPDEDVTLGLAIAEGIETALSGVAAGYPTWACIDAGSLSAFPVLAGIECLTILADHDAAGEKAAAQVAARWRAAGAEVGIAKPETADTDWNDRLQKEAAHD